MKDKIQDYMVFMEVLDLVTNGICITDVNGNILYVNDAFCNVSQYSKEELIGQNPRVLKSGVHNDKFYAKMWKTLMQGLPWTDIVVNKAKDESLYTDRIMITPIKDKTNDKILYFACTRYNIDDSNKLMDQLEQLVAKLHTDFDENKFDD